MFFVCVSYSRKDFLRVSGMLEKNCFCVCQVCLKRNVFLRVSGMLEKRIFFACVRYA